MVLAINKRQKTELLILNNECYKLECLTVYYIICFAVFIDISLLIIVVFYQVHTAYRVNLSFPSFHNRNPCCFCC